MATRDHYVSQFHLREFTDPGASISESPWVWVTDRSSANVFRRAPKNLARSRGLYAGPGGLADRSASIEAYLASYVEGPAAFALRQLLSSDPGGRRRVPAALGRYLAWATARTMSMWDLYQQWIGDLPDDGDENVIEKPPEGFETIEEVARFHRMEHAKLGVRDDVLPEEVAKLRSSGWALVLTGDDFLELAHLQAWYFYVRFFPRLRWTILDAPPSGSFVIGDRPVVWGFDGAMDVPPSALRRQEVQLFAPLTRSVALFADNGLAAPVAQIRPRDVNRAIATAARSWIAGSSDFVVREARADALWP